MIKLSFLYPVYFLLIPVAFFLWYLFWARGRNKYWVEGPSHFVLERFKRECAARQSVLGRIFRKHDLVLVACLAIVPAAAVLAVPVEEKTEMRKIAERREGCFILDVSGSTITRSKQAGEVDVNTIIKEATSKFVGAWLSKNPEDRLCLTVFSNGATPLSRLTPDKDSLTWSIKNMASLTTDYSSGTQLERGIFSGLLLLLPELTVVDSAKIESVLRRSPKNLEEIKKYLGPDMKKWSTRGKFAVIFTDALIELVAERGMAPPLAMIDFLGELGVTPFLILPRDDFEYGDDFGGPSFSSKPIKEQISRAAAKNGGQTYYVGDLKSFSEMDTAVSDIMKKIGPAKRYDKKFTTKNELSVYFGWWYFAGVSLWTIIALSKKRVP